MTDERSTTAGSTERARHAGDDEPAAPRQRRMSAQRRQEAVLRVLRGEDLELVSRELGVTAAALGGWWDSFLSAGWAWARGRIARRRPWARETRPPRRWEGVIGLGRVAAEQPPERRRSPGRAGAVNGR